MRLSNSEKTAIPFLILSYQDEQKYSLSISCIESFTLQKKNLEPENLLNTTRGVNSVRGQIELRLLDFRASDTPKRG